MSDPLRSIPDSLSSSSVSSSGSTVRGVQAVAVPSGPSTATSAMSTQSRGTAGTSSSGSVAASAAATRQGSLSSSTSAYAGPPPPSTSHRLNKPSSAPPQRIVPPRRSSSAVVVPVEGTITPTALFGTSSSSGGYHHTSATGGGGMQAHTNRILSKMPHTPKEYLAPPPHTELTPLRAHYLKRELVGGQLAKELDGLGNPDALSVIGWPFTKTNHSKTQMDAYSTLNPTSTRATSKRQQEEEEETDLPLLRFFFHQFVMTFPFLSEVDADIFYGKKLQPFIGSFMARNISMNEEREEETGNTTKRHKLAGKAEKHLGLLISSAVKLNDNGGREEVVRIVDVKPAASSHDGGVGNSSSSSSPPPLPPKDARNRRTSTSSANSRTRTPSTATTPLTATSQATTNTTASSNSTDSSTLSQQHGFSVNVVGVRSITTKHRLGRKSKHEEFLVKTSRPGYQDAFVARRYGDFVGLSQLLRTEFPDYDIRPPPAKDRRGVDASAATQAANQAQATSMLSPASTASINTQDSDNISISDNSAPVILSRERNRLTLRAYLRHLMTNQDVANSAALQAFLLNGTTTLTPAEEADVARREEMDRLREAESAKFKSEVSNRVRELEQHLRGFKDELVKKDGLTRVFATIRETKNLEDLPVEHQKVMEWARISLASTIYQLFLGTDQSSEIFSQFKRVNGLMPYFMMRQILKISNPVSMIRSAMDLFLARPFGSPSLLQRMFSSGLEAELKELKEDMQRVQEKIQDPIMCERIKRFIYAPRAIQRRYREEAKEEDMDIVTVILRSRDDNMPNLSPASMMRAHRASIAHKEYLAWVATLEDPEEEDEGPDNDDAWLYEDLHVFMRMCMRIRDKEQMLELIFEGNTSDLLKDIVTIFYEPLAKVYKAANISDSLYDLQVFVTDLIKTVEAAEASVTSAAVDPQKTVTIFMDLVQRHEGAFYHFVHSVHSKGEDLFDGLMRWIELFLNFIREGLNPEGITLDFLLPQGESERGAIMQEIDAVIDYHRALKIAHHERLRRRLIKGEAAGAASYTTGSGVVGSPGQVGFGPQDAGEEAAFVDGVLKNLSMTGVADDIDDLNAEEDEDSEEEYDAHSDEFVDAHSGDDTELAGRMGGASLADGQNNHPSWLNQPQSAPIQTVEVVYLPPEPPTSAKSGKKGGKRIKPTKIEEPELVEIPKLVPIFTEMLRPSLEVAQRVQIDRAQRTRAAQQAKKGHAKTSSGGYWR